MVPSNTYVLIFYMPNPWKMTGPAKRAPLGRVSSQESAVRRSDEAISFLTTRDLSSIHPLTLRSTSLFTQDLSILTS